MKNILRIFITVFIVSLCITCMAGISYAADIAETGLPTEPPQSPFAVDLTESRKFVQSGTEYTLHPASIVIDLNNDGKCTASDARAMLRIASRLSTYSGDIRQIDITGDCIISASDARLLLRYSAKLDSYYMSADGAVLSGFVTDPAGKTFYFSKYGAMQKGWTTIGSDKYYFYPDGHMARNETIDGIKIRSNGIAETAVDKSYFNDAAFVGDSISVALASYQSSTKSLGNAQFFASTSLSAANALWNVSSYSVHPSYNGTKMLVEDCIQRSGAKKVYIMLGMNDIGIYSHETSIKNYKELVARIRAKSPGVSIYIQSVTPMTSTSTRTDSKLNNTQIKSYNEKLRAMCKEMGWHYIDVASVMTDSGGYLRQEYCSDRNAMGIHFTYTGCEQWVKYLLTHTSD